MTLDINPNLRVERVHGQWKGDDDGFAFYLTVELTNGATVQEVEKIHRQELTKYYTRASTAGMTMGMSRNMKKAEQACLDRMVYALHNDHGLHPDIAVNVMLVYLADGGLR